MFKHKPLALALVASVVLVGGALGAHRVLASDHDDGVSEMKDQTTNLTDLFVFKESSQNPSVTTNDLIFVLNCSPRSLPRDPYFFHTDARYEFHVTRLADKNATPTGKDDVVLRYEFGAADDSGKQPITVTALRDGETLKATTSTGGGMIMTTPLGSDPMNNTVALGDRNLTVFAGLRKDPFFFDVQQFFKVRASAAKRFGGDTSEPQVTFKAQGDDFTEGYNVLSIVTRVPREFLQGANSDATVFDVWETVSVKQ